jgi:hypothetical protein
MFVDPYGLRDWGMIGGGAIVLANGAIVSLAGGYLIFAVAPEEAASIVLAPLAVHAIGLGGALIETGLGTGMLGWDLIVKGWNDNNVTVIVPPSATSDCK